MWNNGEVCNNLDDISVDIFRSTRFRQFSKCISLDTNFPDLNPNNLTNFQNVSLDEAAKLNGNDKCTMDSLGFGFGDPEKTQDSALIQDFERIQKDTTDFCNIQVSSDIIVLYGMCLICGHDKEFTEISRLFQGKNSLHHHPLPLPHMTWHSFANQIFLICHFQYSKNGIPYLVPCKLRKNFIAGFII